jgi:hypothetical protein
MSIVAAQRSNVQRCNPTKDGDRQKGYQPLDLFLSPHDAKAELVQPGQDCHRLEEPDTLEDGLTLVTISISFAGASDANCLLAAVEGH